MTKAELIEAIYDRVGFSKQESAKAVEMVLDLIKDRLERGESVKISGFGKFSIREKRPRRGRNPRTGQQIEITARRVLTFKPSQLLRGSMGVAPVRQDGSTEEEP